MSGGENSGGTTAPVRCAYCRGQVTLHLSERSADLQRIAGRWNCPYCRKDNTGHFLGHLAWVKKGHETE
jgi:hypothetical protein